MPFIGETSTLFLGFANDDFFGNVIDDSVIFNTGDANTVKWTAGTPTSQDIWTASFWVKRAEQFATRQNIFGVSSGSHNGHISWAANDTLELYNDDSVLTQQKFTSSVHRDPTAWTHWCISFSGAGPDEVVFEKDGVVQSQTTGTDDTISGGAINKSGADMVIGDWLHPSGVPADMILAQFAFIDGTVYSASDFGEFDANGNWGPKSDTDIRALSFGNNGVFFKDGTDIRNGVSTISAPTDRSSYAPPSSMWEGETGDFTLTVDGDVTKATAISWDGIHSKVFTGDFEFYLEPTDSTGNGQMQAGWYSAYEHTDADMTPVNGNTRFGLDNIPNSQMLYLRDSGAFALYEGGSDQSNDLADGTTSVKFQRVGSTITIQRNGSGTHDTSSLTYTGPVRFVIGAYTTGQDWDNISITGTENDMNGADVSGLADTDVVSDSPTNSSDGVSGNYCVWNTLLKEGGTYAYAEGNTQATYTSSTDAGIAGTLGVSSGKYYIEFTAGSIYDHFGIASLAALQDLVYGTSTGGWTGLGGDAYTYYANSGNKRSPSSLSAYGSTFTATDVIGMAIDFDNDAIWFSKNGTWQNSATQGEIEAGTTTNAAFTGVLSGQTWFPFFHPYTNSTVVLNAGQKAFSGTVPTGFNAINSKTIADALAPDGDPDDYYVDVEDTEADVDATLATARSAFSNYVDIYKNEASAEGWVYRFSHDSSNEYIVSTTATYQALAALATGTDNHIGISINVDATKGVVAGSQAHTNGGGDTTITHNLGTTRYIALLFPRNGGEVLLHHPDFTTGELVHLTSVTAPSAIGTFHTFGANSAVIDDTHATDTYDYLFIAESDFFAIGTYTGNASADGPVFYAGGRPRHWAVIADNANNHTFHNELIQSDANPHEDRLFLNTTNAVIVGTNGLDFLATGGKIKGTDNIINGSGEAYFWFSWLAFPVGGTTSSYQQSRAR